MRENDEFGHYVPVLRRVIILVAVVTAVPVVLWTITAFVRAYVAPAKMPTFHQLAATASINAPANNAASDTGSLPQPAERQVLARATATDARDGSLAPKGSLLADHPSDGAANSPPAGTPAPRMADTSTTAWPPPPKATELPSFALPVPDGMTPNNPAPAAREADAAAQSAADPMPAAAPLSGPIPLPRHRPRDLGGTVRMADMAPSSVPIPRPRPDAAGPSTPAETTSAGPLDFIQNLFH
jgi:hypothetical protein